MKNLFAVLTLCALSFGQMPMTKEQKKDCANAIKATKKNDPAKLSVEEFKALLDAMSLACGTPEDYAAKHGPNAAQAEGGDAKCENAMKAVDQDVKKNGPDPTSSRADLNLLIQTMRQACGVPDDVVVANKNQPITPAEQAPHADQVTDSSLNIHELIAQRDTDLNREIALGNRLIAHFQKAQTWEGIDSDHPEAVALREKIAQEEKELREAIRAGDEVNDKIDIKLVQKECTAEEINSLTRLVQETTGVMHDVKTQQDRYHALGY